MNQPKNNLTAAERIIAEHAPEAYRFAPGITVTPPSKNQVQSLVSVRDSIGEDMDEEGIMLVLSVLLGDSYEAVIDYLDNAPVDAYPALFADLFENVIRMVPHEFDMDSFVESTEKSWRAVRPDIFEGDSDG